MFPDRRLHEIWVGKQFSIVFFGGVFDMIFLCLGFFLWSQIYSLRPVLPKHAPLYGGRWLIPVQQPPATAMPILHDRCQRGYSLDWRLWVIDYLSWRSWGFFSGSEVFQRIFVVEEVSGGSATRCWSRLWLLF
jgi:hypothetical protein